MSAVSVPIAALGIDLEPPPKPGLSYDPLTDQLPQETGPDLFRLDCCGTVGPDLHNRAVGIQANTGSLPGKTLPRWPRRGSPLFTWDGSDCDWTRPGLHDPEPRCLGLTLPRAHRSRTRRAVPGIRSRQHKWDIRQQF